mmetsp:Transcript_14193/g.43528  ORF Transcript_14193/g.43528 Transcript_14193/m.43528 type:complete len:202 (-) Transcript_14193:1131-1736(-)
MTFDMRSQNSRSSRRVPSCPVSFAERLVNFMPSLPCPSDWCSSTNALMALMASLGWMSSWLSASARKKERSFSTSAAPSTPRTLSMESIFNKFCSSGDSESNSFWILPSTRKPASLHKSSSILLIFSLSIWLRATAPSSPYREFCSVAVPPAAPSVPDLKICSEGGNQFRPSWCSWMILSACKTLRIRSVTISSFICQTSR